MTLVEDVLQHVSNMDSTTKYCWLGLLYPIYRSLAYSNSPTYRDLPKAIERRERLYTAAFYAPFVPICGIFVPEVFQVFMVLVVYLAMGEFIEIIIPHRISKEDAEKKPPYTFTFTDRVVQVVGAAQLGFCYMYGLYGQALGLGLGIVTIASVYLFGLIMDGHAQKKAGKTPELGPDAFNNLGKYIFGVIWIGWTMGHACLIYNLNHPGIPYPGGWLCVLLLTSWIGDAAALFFGRKFGKTKIMPNISPGKSLEGAIGEFVVACALCCGCKYAQTNLGAFFFPDLTYGEYMFIACVTSFFGIIGDALESLVKRTGKVKDSGRFFSGHGGVLDRFDTFYINGPFLFYWVTLVMFGGEFA